MKPKYLTFRIDSDLLEKFTYVTTYNNETFKHGLLSLIKEYVSDYEKEHGTLLNLADKEQEY